MNDQSNTPINVEALAAKFVELRDKIKEIKDRHKDELAPYNESLDQLSAYILDYLNQVNVDSMRTGAGTVSRTHKDSASVADMEAFWTFVVTQGNFDLCDRKANVTAVREYMEKNHAPVPGVNFSSMQTVSVRRASTTK